MLKDTNNWLQRQHENQIYILSWVAANTATRPSTVKVNLPVQGKLPEGILVSFKFKKIWATYGGVLRSSSRKNNEINQVSRATAHLSKRTIFSYRKMDDKTRRAPTTNSMLQQCSFPLEPWRWPNQYGEGSQPAINDLSNNGIIISHIWKKAYESSLSWPHITKESSVQTWYLNVTKTQEISFKIPDGEVEKGNGDQAGQHDGDRHSECFVQVISILDNDSHQNTTACISNLKI